MSNDNGIDSFEYFGVWCEYIKMKAQCVSNSNIDYKEYGGQGISVCQRWEDSFSAFVDDMGDRPADAVVVRLSSSADFEPHNCKWGI